MGSVRRILVLGMILCREMGFVTTAPSAHLLSRARLDDHQTEGYLMYELSTSMLPSLIKDTSDPFKGLLFDNITRDLY